MSLFTMLDKKPAPHKGNTPRVLRVSNTGKALLGRYSNKSDDYMAACILAALSAGRQSEMRLPAITGASPARVSRLLNKMFSRGLIAPVKQKV